MAGILRTALKLLSLGVALSAPSLLASEPCCSITDCVEAACQAPCQGCTAGDSCDVSCACEEYCRCCGVEPSLWNAYVGAIFLTRDGSNAGRIIAADPAGAPAFLSGANFNFDTQAGVDTTISRRLANGDSIEARYFGVDDIFASNTIVTPGTFIGVGFTGPGGTTAFSRYWTLLDSVELNYKRAVNERISVLAGFRYLDLDDTLRTTLNGNVATGLYEFDNNMYGGQIGLDWLLTDPCRALELRVIGKAGWYHNEYSGGIREFQGNNFIGSFVGTGEGTSFVGDLVVSAAYWFNEHIALRAGYQLLWVGDVALAGDEASRSILNPSLLRNPQHDGDMFLHGAMIGLEFQW